MTDTIEAPARYPGLYQFAKSIQVAWTDRKAIDWQDAEDLIGKIGKMDAEHRAGLSKILEQAEEDDWDSGEVEHWPKTVIEFLEDAPGTLFIENIDDHCQVLNARLSGESEWVATVCTRDVAECLIGLYQ